MGSQSGLWQWYLNNREAVSPLLAPLANLLSAAATLVVGIFLALAALRQAKTATAQAETASKRHTEQTLADRQRRITESFTKATEQLGSDRIEGRLGGIYTLERLSNESAEDYLTVMETLTAFVRERARLKAPAKDAQPTTYYIDETPGQVRPPGRVTDIAAVLTVIRRRKKPNFSHSKFDLSNADLRGALLSEAILANANLQDTNLYEADFYGADLSHATLTDANLGHAHLGHANLSSAYLNDANLAYTSLYYADLSGARLSGADLSHANLTNTNLTNAELSRVNLTDADLRGARGLTQIQLNKAYGINTWLPDGLTILPGSPDNELATTE